MASSPTDIQPVLDLVAENAARLCEATDAVSHRIDGDKIRVVANYGPLPGQYLGLLPIDRDSIPGRAIIERQTLALMTWQHCQRMTFERALLETK